MIPKLRIFDHESESYYRFRYYDKNEKKYKYQMARYGKKHTKEDALNNITRKRDALIDDKFQF